MKRYIVTALTIMVILAMSILSIIFSGFHFSQNQMDILIILLIICGSSVLYCFVVGEIARNNSQMDKLWSILPIAYVWVIAIKGGMDVRLIVYAVLVTIWGIRLTINFGRKDAYKLKFWEGEEDYRWAILRARKPFNNKFVWALFDLFFISLYQNALVLAICLPALACVESTSAFGVWDYVASGLALSFLTLETIADEQQWKFQQTKKKMLKEGHALEELPTPYCLGFNTTGLWGFFRHPNYLGEQGFWMSLYIFAIGAAVTTYGVFHVTIIGPLFLIMLFQGSSTLGEAISSKKYPKYKDYIAQVFKYLPLRRFKDR